MNSLHDDNYWLTYFDITNGDLNRVVQQLEQRGTPQDLQEIALLIIRGLVEDGHDNIDQQAKDILLKYGKRIVSRLTEALQSDSRFTSLEDKWFIADKVPRIGRNSLQKIHRILLQASSLSPNEILSLAKEHSSIDKALLKMAIHSALRRSPERFENTGSATQPQWKARLPDVEQAEVTHYAYDPETYEVLCHPGQRLNHKKAQRLEELKLYAHVVTFAEKY